MKKQWFSIDLVFIMIALVVILWLSIYNYLYYDKFLDVNVGILLTSFIAVTFAYYLSQRKLEERKKKDQIEHLLQKMQKMLMNNFTTRIQSIDDLNYNTMFQRSFDNKIKILTNLNYDLLEKKTLTYISNEFEEYRNTIGDNYGNFENLKLSEKKMSRIISNIDDKLESLILSLYKL